jgi:hypothetical protein
MLTAFKEADKAPQRGYYRFRSPSYTRLSSPTAEQPLVYYLFGHHEDRESLVLTEADLIEFLVAIVGAKPPVPDQVRSILADPDASYLFLGRWRSWRTSFWWGTALAGQRSPALRIACRIGLAISSILMLSFWWGWQEIATAHDAMVTAPDELARRLARFGSTVP